jgi:hypothetical protein
MQLAARYAFNNSMLPSMETVAALFAVLLAGTLLLQLASWVRYGYKIRKIPLSHNLSLFDRLFTRKAQEEFVTDFRNLSRKGLSKVDLPHFIKI